jgi:hypothetical protein
MPCNPSLYHYEGYCFNKGRVPDGKLAIPVGECQCIDTKKEVISTIIS